MLPRMLTVGHGAGVYTLCVLGVIFVLPTCADAQDNPPPPPPAWTTSVDGQAFVTTQFDWARATARFEGLLLAGR